MVLDIFIKNINPPDIILHRGKARKMKTGLKVLDAMTKTPVTVDSEAAVQKCARIMKDNMLGSIMVEKDGNLIGIVSEQDFVYKVICNNLSSAKTKVSDIMTTDVITIEPGCDIYEALIRMRDLNVRRLPVVVDGELVGILTQKDILKIQPQLFEIIVEKIKLRDESSKPINRIGEKEGICEFCGEYTDFLYEEDGALICEKCRD